MSRHTASETYKRKSGPNWLREPKESAQCARGAAPSWSKPACDPTVPVGVLEPTAPQVSWRREEIGATSGGLSLKSPVRIKRSRRIESALMGEANRRVCEKGGTGSAQGRTREVGDSSLIFRYWHPNGGNSSTRTGMLVRGHPAPAARRPERRGGAEPADLARRRRRSDAPDPGPAGRADGPRRSPVRGIKARFDNSGPEGSFRTCVRVACQQRAAGVRLDQSTRCQTILKGCARGSDQGGTNEQHKGIKTVNCCLGPHSRSSDEHS